MAAHEGPYQGYESHNFDTGNLPAPVRGNAPLTSTFDKPPVRGVAPVHAGPLTSEFEMPPVRGVAPGTRARAPPLTSQFDEPGVAPVRATASVTPPMISKFDEPPVKGVVGSGAPPVREDVVGGSGGGAGQITIRSGQTPTLSGNKGEMGYGRPLPFAMVVADVVLRSLTSLCLVIALALFARFLSDVNTDGSVSDTSPKYTLIMTIIGLLYSLFKLTSAIFRLTMGKLMLPTELFHLISYIGDQVFMGLFLTIGSVGASYLTAIQCSQGAACGRAAGGVVMAFFAFAFIATSSILSTFSFYKKRN